MGTFYYFLMIIQFKIGLILFMGFNKIYSKRYSSIINKLRERNFYTVVASYQENHQKYFGKIKVSVF
jgi:hypothetical protein